MADSHSLLERIASAAAGMDPGLTDADIVRPGGGGTPQAAAPFGGAGRPGGVAGRGRDFWPGCGPRRRPPSRSSRFRPPPSLLRLHDGSTATPLDAASVLAVREDSPGRVARWHSIEDGLASRSRRALVVFSRCRWARWTVTVVGTVFTVDRVADRIGVSVERGTVRVDWKVGAQELHAV